MNVVPQADNPDLSDALRIVSQRALALTRANGAAIALAHKGSMICRASVGITAPALGCRLDTTSGFSGECVRIGSALRCDDTETDPRVDVESCRRLGIRSILAAPIRLNDEIVGILEVFSGRPSAFDSGHLAVIDRLAQASLPRSHTAQTIPAPKLLLEPEPAYRVFIRNLTDILCPPRTTALKLTSAPAAFWADVFVPSRLPWERFLQSVMAHVVMIAALAGILRFSLTHDNSVHRLALKKSEVIYYSPAEYLQARGATRVPSQVQHKGQMASARQPIMKVRSERIGRLQAESKAPELKLKPELQLLHLVALNPVVPAMPIAATTRSPLITPPSLVSAVAPPPSLGHAVGRQAMAGLNRSSVIGPPPEMSAISGSRVPSTPHAMVVGPPPSVRGLVRQMDGINVGYVEVVAPAPQISRQGQDTFSTMIQAGLRDAATSVVPPPPSIGSSRGISSNQSMVSAMAQAGLEDGASSVVPPPPSMGGSSNQGTLSARVQAGLRDGAGSVVPPPPSVGGSNNHGMQRMNSWSGVPTQVAAPPAVVVTASMTVRSRSISPIASIAPPPVTPPSREQVSDNQAPPGATKEISVNLIGLALSLPSSSYFSSHEVFVAEGRSNRYKPRLIKLVYEFLPYQPRLSEFGPNYPGLDRLRVTRDPTCDATLVQVMSSVNATQWSQPDRLQQDVKNSGGEESTLECYRTTADDYRRARSRRR